MSRTTSALVGVFLTAFLLWPTLVAAQTVPCAAEPDPTPLAYGDSTTCEISGAGDTDPFSFSGQAGERIGINATRASGAADFFPCVFLVDSNLDPVAEACSATEFNQLDVVLPATGSYTIAVNDDDLTETGFVNVFLGVISPPPPYAPTLPYGDADSSTISLLGEVRPYTFAGTAGDLIGVSATRSAGASSFSPCILLLDEAGDSLASECSGGNHTATLVTLPGTETYSLFVGDFQSNDTGSYNVFLGLVSPPPPYAIPLPYGSSVGGDITLLGEADPFSFSGQSGDSITITVSRTAGDSSFNPCVLLLDEAGGASGFSCDASSSNSVALDLPSSGIFTVFVNDDDHSELGSYEIAIVGPVSVPLLFGPVAAFLAGGLIVVGVRRLRDFREQGPGEARVF